MRGPNPEPQAAYTGQSFLQLALLSLWVAGRGTTTNTTLAAAALALISTLTLGVLSTFEHNRNLRPSAIIQCFFVATILLDIPRVRTQWMFERNSSVSSVFLVTLLLRVVLLGLESLQKWKNHADLPEGVSREMMQGIFGHTFFWWINPLFLIGYKRDIHMDDLYQVDANLRGEGLGARLLKSWDKGKNGSVHELQATRLTFLSRSRQNSKALSLHCLYSNLSSGALDSIPAQDGIHWVLNGTTFSGAQHSKLHFFTPKHAERQRIWFDISIRFMLHWNCCQHPISSAFTLPLNANAELICPQISTRFYMYLAFRTMTKVRGALVGTIYKTMLSIRAESGNSSSALSLMSTDVDRITITAYVLINIGPDIIQVALALWILATQLGTSSISAMILCLVCAIFGMYIAKLVPLRQTKWMAAIQKRVGITSDIIGSMKGIKVAGLSNNAENQIQGLRDFELAQSTQFRKIQVVSTLAGT